MKWILSVYLLIVWHIGSCNLVPCKKMVPMNLASSCRNVFCRWRFVIGRELIPANDSGPSGLAALKSVHVFFRTRGILVCSGVLRETCGWVVRCALVISSRWNFGLVTFSLSLIRKSCISLTSLTYSHLRNFHNGKLQSDIISRLHLYGRRRNLPRWTILRWRYVDLYS